MSHSRCIMRVAPQVASGVQETDDLFRKNQHLFIIMVKEDPLTTASALGS